LVGNEIQTPHFIGSGWLESLSPIGCYSTLPPWFVPQQCHPRNLRRVPTRHNDVDRQWPMLGAQFSGKLKCDECAHAVSEKGKRSLQIGC
jgi:hypothetical protein